MRMNVYLPRHIDQESQAFLDFIRWQRIELLNFIRCHRIKKCLFNFVVSKKKSYFCHKK